MKIAKLPTRIILCASIALLAAACQNAPRYKKGSGKFDEWQSYQGKGFAPSGGHVAAVDVAAGTITMSTGKDTRVLKVTKETRIIHEDTDIPLAQLPLNQGVKYVMSQNGKRLMSVWYGNHSFAFRRPGNNSKNAKPISAM
ncbi:MAG TPA: hypothetical protein VHY22_18025 [Chthoniobacteraceae bacterium]|jgi:hypothetical protein|nr:hypothetical protein [Chthoniobacteraceae bacterium]